MILNIFGRFWVQVRDYEAAWAADILLVTECIMQVNSGHIFSVEDIRKNHDFLIFKVSVDNLNFKGGFRVRE